MSAHHIFPIEDGHPHSFNGVSCECCPDLVTRGNMSFVVHQFFDGRDFPDIEPLMQQLTILLEESS